MELHLGFFALGMILLFIYSFIMIIGLSFDPPFRWRWEPLMVIGGIFLIGTILRYLGV